MIISIPFLIPTYVNFNSTDLKP